MMQKFRMRAGSVNVVSAKLEMGVTPRRKGRLSVCHACAEEGRSTYGSGVRPFTAPASVAADGRETPAVVADLHEPDGDPVAVIVLAHGAGGNRDGAILQAYAEEFCARGLLVVDHTYDHDLLTSLSYDKVVWEITQPYNGSNYVRPPYGATNSTVDSILAKYHKNNCLWNVDPRDWAKSTSRAPLEVPDFKVSPQQAADYIVGNAWGGSTVVVHLQHLGTDPALLKYIDDGLRDRGLSLCRSWGRASNASMPNMYCL